MADEKRTSSPHWIEQPLGTVLKPLKSKRDLLDEKRMREAASGYGYFEIIANRHEKILEGHGIKPRHPEAPDKWAMERAAIRPELEELDEVLLSLEILVAYEQISLFLDHCREKDAQSTDSSGREEGATLMLHRVVDIMIRIQAYEILQYEAEIVAGIKTIDGAARGGRRAGQTLARDLVMAKKFLKRRDERQKGSRISQTALKVGIGAENDLKKSAAIEAINRGMRALTEK